MGTRITTTKGEFKELLKESLNGLAKDGNPELKALIKSCIQEVMMESAAQMPPQIQQQPLYPQQFNPYMQPSQPMNPYAQQPMNPYTQQQQQQNYWNQVAQTTAQQMSKGNPGQAKLFEKILADTAQTSLQKTLQFDERGFTEEQVVKDQKDMTRLGMQNAKGRWAELAFNNQASIIPPQALLG